MRYEKDGDIVRAISTEGAVLGYIKKDRFGTHGHWRGYLHYVLCKENNKLIWAGINEREIFPDRPYTPWKSWTDAPTWFANVKEFKEYYDSKE